MGLIIKKLTINNKQGLHARPAAIFVQTANKFNSAVTIRRGKEEVNGKSIMGILMLGAERGARITLEIEGSDAELALAELEKILNIEE
ncbi:MAG: HPr family phosphocarrier protein [Candidatus Omnitrophota bacterium]